MNTFYFPSDFHFNFGSPKAKAEANISAIQLLKKLENENRLPDPAEQMTLAHFTGFGDTGVLRHTQLIGLSDEITVEELDSLNASTLNAHYTDLDIIRAVWAGVLHLGFGSLNEIKVLDSSAGVGHFLSCLPEELQAITHRAEIELDKLTARMLTKLHPDVDGMSKVYAMGFEQVSLMDNWFDLAISNVPFGNYAVIDRSIKDKALRANIHDYFFVRALRAVKPGGIIAFITSRYTMDKKETGVREYLARHADLLTAIRLPRGTFRKNAGTEVVTDLIILRKKTAGKRAEEPGKDEPLPSWVGTTEIQIKRPRAWNDDDEDGSELQNHEEWFDEATVNTWFAEHPNLMIGVPALIHGMYRGDEFSVNYDGEDVAEQLRLRLIESLPADLVVAHEPTTLLRDPVGAENNKVEEERETFSDEYAILVSSKATDTAKEQLQKLREIHKAAKQLLNAEVDDGHSGSISILRDLLNRLYDDYLFRYGPINKPQTIKLLGNSPAAPFLKALEKNFDPKRSTAEKADIFYTPTLRSGYRSVKIETAQDALLVCLGETGSVDISYIASLAGKEEEKAIKDLDGLIYLDPETSIWLTAEKYLSGNVREKLEKARAAAELDGRFTHNVKALEESLPKPLKPSEIKAHLGATWIPVGTVEEFIEHLLPGAVTTARVKVTMLPAVGSWHVEFNRHYDWGLPEFENRTKYGTKDFSALELIDCILNSQSAIVYEEIDVNGEKKRVVNKTETIAAQAKKTAIEAAFEEWIWADGDRAEKMAAIYNEKINVYRRPIYNGSHLKLPGLSWGVPVAPYQLNAIWRAVQSKTTLFGHEVGLGKTRMAVISIMEMVRLGMVKKAMVVCPNHVVGQWHAEIVNAYPAANVLCATPKDLSKFCRQEFMSRIATGHWDIVIVPQSSFKALPVGPEVMERFTTDQLIQMRAFLEELKEEGAPYSARKTIEKAVKNFQAKLDELADMKKDSDQTITFEQLGVGMLVVDEYHYFKNLFFASKMTNVAGLPRNKTERAWDMFIKIRQLLENNGRFIGLTATPVTNSITEAFVMQQYFQYDELQEMGFGHFDNWAKVFTEAVTGLEMTADGSGFQLVTRLSRYTNLPELSAMFGQFAEMLRWKDVPQEIVKRPELFHDRPTVIVTPGSEYLKEFITQLAERVQKIKSGDVTPTEDNMLLVTTDGRKAALDINLIDPSLPEPPYSKITVASDLIANIYHATAKWKSTQLVFSDLGTPNSEKGARHKKTKQEDAINVRPEKLLVDNETCSQVEAISPADIEIKADADEVKELDEADVSEAEHEESKPAVAVDEVALASLYVRFKKKLVEHGVREEEIAFIHDAKSTAERNVLFEAVREGKIRILVGSTEKMGTGMNAQTRVIALHHLDAPWRPADITQRDGRMLRQGNRFSETFIFTYITDSSPDGFVWQKLETKNAAIEQFMHGLLTQRDMDDVSDVTLSMAEIKAAASGNPKIVERVALQSEVVRLVHMHASWMDNQRDLRFRARDMRNEIDGLSKRLNALATAQKIASDNQSGDNFQMMIGQSLFTERKAAGEAINNAAIKVRTLALHSRSKEERAIGTYRGFRLIVRSYPPSQATFIAGAQHAASEDVLLDFGDETRLVAHVGETGMGTIQSMDAILRGLEELRRKDQEHRDALAMQHQVLTEGLTKPWEHEKRYIKLQQRLFLIDKALTEGGVNITEAGGDIPTIASIKIDGGSMEEEQENLAKLMNSPSNRSNENIIEVNPIEGQGSDSWIINSREMVDALKRLAEIHALIPAEEELAATKNPLEVSSELFSDLRDSAIHDGKEETGCVQIDLFGAIASKSGHDPSDKVEMAEVETTVQVAPPPVAISILQDDGGPLPIETWLTTHAPTTSAPHKRKSKSNVAHGQLSLF